jgi:hypothetical protein
VNLAGATVGVAPQTPGGPKIWVGGHSDAALRRALRFGAGWHGAALDPAGVADIRARLVPLAEEAGRDPATLEISNVCFFVPPGIEGRPTGAHLLGGDEPSAASVLDELGELQEAGVSVGNLWMPIAPAAVEPAMDWIATELLPKVAAN